jgi:hypothetical protein
MPQRVSSARVDAMMTSCPNAPAGARQCSCKRSWSMVILQMQRCLTERCLTAFISTLIPVHQPHRAGLANRVRVTCSLLGANHGAMSDVTGTRPSTLQNIPGKVPLRPGFAGPHAPVCVTGDRNLSGTAPMINHAQNELGAMHAAKTCSHGTHSHWLFGFGTKASAAGKQTSK